MNAAEISLKNLDKNKLYNTFDILIKGKNKMIVVDGQGRSLESLLLAEDCLEHNGFPIILPSTNANLRPCVAEDILFVNTGSAKGSIKKHAEEAYKIGMRIIGMTTNQEFADQYPDLMLIPLNKEKNSIYAPLGTEFEFCTAIIGSLIGYSIADTPEKSVQNFDSNMKIIIDLLRTTYQKYHEEDSQRNFLKFKELIQDYLPKANTKKIYFRGVGRDMIVSRVAAIRYGHLHKEPELDLRVIYEGHWDLREKEDLIILISGSGSTSQTMNYALQAFISGANIFGLTSFKDSDLGKFCARNNGCIEVLGRKHLFSMYNIAPEKRLAYLPEFELNTYITLDALLAQIAYDNKITEKDMELSHRQKIFE